MTSWVQHLPLRREAIIHAICFGPNGLVAVGDDEAMSIYRYAAKESEVVRRWEDLSTVLSVCLLRPEGGPVVAAGGTLRGYVGLRSCEEGEEERSGRAALAAGGGGGGVRAVAAHGDRLVAGDEGGRVRVWRVDRDLACAFLFKVKEARAAVEGLALVGARLAVATSVLGSHDGPLLACYALGDESPFVECFPRAPSSSSSSSDDDDDSDGDGDPFAPTLVARVDVRADAASKCADVYTVDLDGELLVAGGADGSLALWRWRDDAGGAPVALWRTRCGTSVNAVSCRARRVVAVAVPADGANATLQIRDVRGDSSVSPAVDLVVPRWSAATTAGVAEDCAACGTSVNWTGTWQAACPVCGPSAVVNACALAPAGDAVLAGGYDRALTCWAPPPPATEAAPP